MSSIYRSDNPAGLAEPSLLGLVGEKSTAHRAFTDCDLVDRELGRSLAGRQSTVNRAGRRGDRDAGVQQHVIRDEADQWTAARLARLRTLDIMLALPHLFGRYELVLIAAERDLILGLLERTR